MPAPRNCTFSRDDWTVLAACWHPVARIADLGDEPTAIRLLDQEKMTPLSMCRER